jgi:GT2 family glycosyltransferase
VIHFQAPYWAARTVETLLEQQVRSQVIVLDNSAGDPTASEALRQALPHGLEIWPLPDNPGYAGAANRAIDDWIDHHPESRLAFILCHDCLLERDATGRMIETLSRYPQIGLVGPVFDPRPTGWNDQVDVAPRSAHWISGACMAMRKEVVESGVRFRSDFGSYVEDVAFCLDANDRGWGVAIDPRARAVEQGSQAGEGRWLLIARNTMLLAHSRRGNRGLVLAASHNITGLIMEYLASLDQSRDEVRRQKSRDRAEAIARGTRQAFLRLRNA